jgi:hypothetical protein
VKRLRIRFDVAIVVLFLGAVLAPTFDLFVREDIERGPAPEFRNPAPKPGFPRDSKEFYKFSSAYEAHFNDTFGLRDKLLRLNSAEKYFGLGTSPAKAQIVGRDGWIYYAGDRSMEIIRGALAFDEGQLADWQAELEQRSRMHATGGRRYVFVLIPNKETIYPERLPSSILPSGPTRMDQFFAWMREHSTVDVLDLRPAFLAAKKDDTGPMDPLYTPHGTHWTSRGVYAAYAAIVGHLAEGTSCAGPHPLSEFDIVRYENGADSFASNLYLTGLLVQPGDSLFYKVPNVFTVIEQKDSSPKWLRTRGNRPDLLPHAIFFHDSFGPFIAHTLANAFQTLDLSEGLYDRSRIQARDTKIVVEMFVERYLRNHQPDPRVEPPLDEDGGDFLGLKNVLFDLATTPDAAHAVEGLGLTRTDDGGFRLERRGAKDGLVLGPIRVPKSGEVRMLVDLEAEEPASLDVMWRRLPDGAFTRIARTQLPIGRGRETRDVVVPIQDGEYEIMLRPTDMRPAVVVHACAIRSAQAP